MTPPLSSPEPLRIPLSQVATPARLADSASRAGIYPMAQLEQLMPDLVALVKMAKGGK